MDGSSIRLCVTVKQHGYHDPGRLSVTSHCYRIASDDGVLTPEHYHRVTDFQHCAANNHRSSAKLRRYPEHDYCRTTDLRPCTAIHHFSSELQYRCPAIRRDLSVQPSTLRQRYNTVRRPVHSGLHMTRFVDGVLAASLTMTMPHFCETASCWVWDRTRQSAICATAQLR